MPYSNQKKGMLLAFTAIMFITPDSLLIRFVRLDSNLNGLETILIN